MHKVLIIGATSAIADATARLFAAQGDELFLVARNPVRLEAIKQDLEVRGANKVETAVLDINDLAEHETLLDAAWSALHEVDVALVAHGTLPDQKACQASAPLTVKEFNTNATSTIALLTLVASRLETQKKGTLVVISSVAGDRGRASNYVYGAAKAALTAFASGLRQRLFRSGINVITIKPGFVDTPMTVDFKKGLLWAQPETIANGIFKAINKGRSVVYLPWFWRLVMLIIQHIPEPLFKRIKI
ncbi:MAG: SDR family oxidoreductase [Gammaproteobacteria bacterium]